MTYLAMLEAILAVYPPNSATYNEAWHYLEGIMRDGESAWVNDAEEFGRGEVLAWIRETYEAIKE